VVLRHILRCIDGVARRMGVEVERAVRTTRRDGRFLDAEPFVDITMVAVWVTNAALGSGTMGKGYHGVH
jgi:hypothetical protein